MAKVSIRVASHRNHPEKFIELLKDIVSFHEQQGANSQLLNSSVIDMAEFKTKVLQAEKLRNESISHRALAESKMNQAKVLMGFGNGQSINHEGTLYFMLDGIKRLLLAKNRGTPEVLSEYGFDVVVSNAKGIGRPKKKKD